MWLLIVSSARVLASILVHVLWGNEPSFYLKELSSSATLASASQTGGLYDLHL